MDSPAFAALAIIVMAFIVFGAALGGTTLVYLVDQRRQDSPRPQAQGSAPEASEVATTVDRREETPERRAA